MKRFLAVLFLYEEQRKIDLEERRLHLAAFMESKISEEKAASLAVQLLEALKDYRNDLTSPHFAEDRKLVGEILASLSKDTSQ
jgi:hypothetical protein